MLDRRMALRSSYLSHSSLLPLSPKPHSLSASRKFEAFPSCFQRLTAFPQFSAFNIGLSTLPKSFRIRFYAKIRCNSFRIRFYELHRGGTPPREFFLTFNPNRRHGP